MSTEIETVENKLSAAERAEERRKKLIWEEAIMEASMLKGILIVSWKPLYTVNKNVYRFEEVHHHKLLQLRLIGVQLKELPEDFGTSMRQLELLSLENNHLEILPDSITELLNLTELNLSFNRLKKLPVRIGFMYKLQWMPLNNNQLTELPVTFGALTALQKIDIECNKLRILPENLENMLSCHSLNANRNHLIRLPRCLSRMPSLATLSACWNELSYIPQELFSSKTITCLRLGTNSIKRISERIGDMTQLQELILDYNHIAKLPLAMWKLKSLKIFRMEGNEELIDPPTEIVVKGAETVIKYFTDIFLSDKQARMRHIILTTQNVLEQISERKLYDPSLFEPDVKVAESSEDYWYGLQLSYFWNELLPQIKHVWKYLHNEGIVIPDIVTEFEFNEKEVMWAFTNYLDAYGPVLLHQRAMFRQCSCKDLHGNLIPCIPPRQGYMCTRLCYLMKKHLVRQKDKEDRIWQAYKSQSLIDAEKRAEFEANNYLQSNAGQRWLDDSAYEQAEELMLDQGATKVVEKRIQQAEKEKQKIIKRFNKKIAKVEKLRNKKVKGIQEELNKLKETRKLAREGYLRDGLEFKINELTLKLQQMPESVELNNLHAQCAEECEKVDERLYESSSENDEDIHHTSDDDSNAYSEDDSSEEAVKWRKRRIRRKKKEQQERALQMMKKKFGSDGPRNPTLKQIGDVLDNYVMNPIVKPLGSKLTRSIYYYHYKTSKSLRNIKEISKIRIRKVLFKIIGNFDEAQKELRYEIARQYVEHQVNVAREKARKEFQVIEAMRQKFQGVSKEKAFIAWKKWVWTKQKRLARDLRRQYKTAIKWYNSSMESVRSAQIQVDMWIPEVDIYTDRPYWQHAKTGQITFDQPTVQFYLPPNFKIPESPPLPPEGVDINAITSSSESSLGEWQRKYGQRRRNNFNRPQSKPMQNIIDEDYHDDIINRNVLKIDGDKQLQYIADSDDNDSIVSKKDEEDQARQKQLIRRTMRTPNKLLLPNLPRPADQNQLIPAPITEITSVDNSSYRTSRSAKSRSKSILALTQLNSPFDKEENLDRTIQQISLPPILPSPRPDNIQEAAIQIKAKMGDEFEIAYKAIRKKRNQLSVARHNTYMAQVNRKEKSFEQIKAEGSMDDLASTSLIEVESGVFIDSKEVKDLINPTDEELFRLAGGTLDMKNMGKKGIDLRTVLATRALHIKQKLYEKAVEKQMVKPKRYNFYRKEIRPLFVDIYHDSDSEDESVVEQRKKEAKAALRAQRRAERNEQRKLKDKLEGESLTLATGSTANVARATQLPNPN